MYISAVLLVILLRTLCFDYVYVYGCVLAFGKLVFHCHLLPQSCSSCRWGSFGNLHGTLSTQKPGRDKNKGRKVVSGIDTLNIPGTWVDVCFQWLFLVCSHVWFESMFSWFFHVRIPRFFAAQTRHPSTRNCRVNRKSARNVELIRPGWLRCGRGKRIFFLREEMPTFWANSSHFHPKKYRPFTSFINIKFVPATFIAGNS